MSHTSGSTMASSVVSRRGFLKALAASVGLAVAGLELPQLVAKAAEAKEAKPLAPPWPYVRLDPEETRKLGHLGYYAFECAGGAFWAIAVQLAEKIGFPWNIVAIYSREEVIRVVNEGEHPGIGFFQYGYGGAVGYGSLCGALNGSLLVINLVAKSMKDVTRIGQALMRWYESTPLPSEKINRYVVEGEVYVKPERLKSRKWLPQSVAGSVLCHVSVGRWCRVSGYASGSKERSERCARITGDVAAKTVELLNAYFEGRLDEVARVEFSPTTVSCRTCHFKGKEYSMGQFTRGFMQCETCHADLRPHAHMFVNLGSQSISENEGKLFSVLKTAAASTLATGLVFAGALVASRKRGRKE